MSTFKDIIDTLVSIEGDVVDHIVTGQRNQSLSKQSKDGIMNFPVLISNTLSIEDGTLVSKALEKNFASFALVTMTMNPNLHSTNPNAAQYVKQFHQNIDVKSTPTDLLNAINSFTTEALNKFDIDYESIEGMKSFILHHVYEGVDYHIMNNLNAKFIYTIQDVTESTVVNELCNRSEINGVFHPTMENGRGTTINLNTPQNMEFRMSLDMGDNGIDSDDMGRAIGRELARGQQTSNGRATRQLQHMMDNDVKKANELVPTLLHMRIYPYDKNGSEHPPIDFVLGVKATLHPIPSDEMVTNICRGIKNENTFFNFVRWTTGEIKFFRDFVFCINEMKIDALNSSQKASRWWSMLKRRRALAKIKNVILPNKMIPNATIVITQDEVNVIKEVYGYDISKISLINKLMANYFLLGFVIVDPALQRVKFLFDGNTEFETLTYATLARESSTNDKQFKEMLNMLGRRM